MIDVCIMCAGSGKRLLPHTAKKPKAMIKILEKPIIHWIFDSLEELDIGYVYLITGYRYNIIEPYVKTNIDSYVRVVRQKKRTGTADAINLVKDMVGDEFIVLAGDTIFNSEDLKKLADWENSLLYTYQEEKLHEFGTLDLNKNYIRHINEKSTEPTSNLVNCSAYHFNKDMFEYIPKTSVDKRFGERIITNTINLMIDDGYKFGGIRIKELNEVTRSKDIKIIERRLEVNENDKNRRLWRMWR